MAEPMSDKRLERLTALAELPCSCDNADCQNYMSALTAQQAQELAAETQQLREQLAARVAELQRAVADVDMTFRLSRGGGWCATCRWPMREGTTVVKTLAVVCEPCAADLAATAGRLDPDRLAARKAATLGTEDAT